MVPNSQQGVFASSGFASYYRRVQKSFSDFVGSDKIGRVLILVFSLLLPSTSAWPSPLLVLCLLP